MLVYSVVCDTGFLNLFFQGAFYSRIEIRASLNLFYSNTRVTKMMPSAILLIFYNVNTPF
jgi:hypothetical protein